MPLHLSIAGETRTRSCDDSRGRTRRFAGDIPCKDLTKSVRHGEVGMMENVEEFTLRKNKGWATFLLTRSRQTGHATGAMAQMGCRL